jgi:ribosome biogenesis GTPase A
VVAPLAYSLVVVMAKSWYPGHMVATQKSIRELAPYLTAFVEVVDARAPELTRHRPLATWVGRTPVVVVLNKADVANSRVTEAWVAWYKERGVAAIPFSAKDSSAPHRLRTVVEARYQPPYRLAVVGVPNVGKSTILNRMVGRHRVRTGGKPGITRGRQWIRVGNGWEWLDLPGVVTPAKSRDWRLKVLGIVAWPADEAEQLADFVWTLVDHGPDADWMSWGRRRGYLGRGGAVDVQRTAEALIRSFQAGELGAMSLETPDQRETQ